MEQAKLRKLKTQLRFPTFFERTEWKEKKLGEIFRERIDKGYPEKTVLSATQDKGVIPYQLLEKSVIRDNQNLAGYKLVKSGDFVISLRSFEGGFEYSKYDGIISPAYVILERKQEINDVFFQFLFKSDYFITAIQSFLNNNLRDGKSISYKQAKDIDLLIPEIDEQQVVADCLASIDELITAENCKLEALKSHKKGLIQSLLPSRDKASA